MRSRAPASLSASYAGRKDAQAPFRLAAVRRAFAQRDIDSRPRDRPARDTRRGALQRIQNGAITAAC